MTTLSCWLKGQFKEVLNNGDEECVIHVPSLCCSRSDVTIPDVDLQWAPLPKVLLRSLSRRNGLEEALDEQGSVVIVVHACVTSYISCSPCVVCCAVHQNASMFSSFQPPPGEMTHSCIFPGAAWEVPAQRAAVLDGVPFTHPAHVPLLLELLRHQCAINTLLASAIAPPCASPGQPQCCTYRR